MKSMQSTRILALGLLTTVAFLGTDLAGQQDPSKNQSRRQQITADPVVTLEFSGGSLADFAAALRKAGEDINIVLPASAAKVELPALTLSQATVESALKSIGAITSEDMQVRVETLRSPNGKPVYAVNVRERPSRSAGAATSGPVTQAGPFQNSLTQVSVFSLKFLTETVPGDITGEGLTMKPETILTAIDTGLGIQNRTGGPKSEFKYHEDSGLLFLEGTNQEINLVHNILNNMQDDMRRLREAGQREEQRKQQQKQVEENAKRNQKGPGATGR